MKAIIKIGGKQYTVEQGSKVYVEKVNANVDDTVVFNEVLMLGDKVGNPYVKEAKVEAKVLKHGKQKKIRIFTYVSKNRSNRRTLGHRQPYTQLEITKVG